MSNLNTRKHSRKARLKNELRERQERAQKANEPWEVLKRACKFLKYSILADGVNDEAQMRILDEYISSLDELEDELRLKYGELPKSSYLRIAMEKAHAINAICHGRLAAISPEHDPDDGNDKFPFRSIG